jgi:PQQ-like domain
LRRLLAVAAIAAILGVCVPVRPAASGGDEGGILTFGGDTARTGWNRGERLLTPATVASLRKLWTTAVDGGIFAQPLVVPGLAMFGRVRTVVYVATVHDRLYALDAADGRVLWGPVALGTPAAVASSCVGVSPAGIIGTPVVDRGAGTLYVAGLTVASGGRGTAYTIAALDVKSGATRPGWPVELSPPAASGFHFEPSVQQQRGALTLVGGIVYVPFGGYAGDCGAYHGWIVAVQASAPRRQEALVIPAGRAGAGISGTGGLAADGEGRLYAATGHSDSGDRTGFGNSVVRLLTSPLRFSGAARDYFTPRDARWSTAGPDLGQATPLVLPGDSVPPLVFVAAGQGAGYLVNRDDMGGRGKENSIGGDAVYSRCIFAGCAADPAESTSAAAYWEATDTGGLILVPGRGRQPAPCERSGGIAALRRTAPPATRRSILALAWCSASMRDPGTPAASGTGRAGVVWVVDRGAGVLYALDARSGRTLYVSRGADALHSVQGSVTPSIWGGRVYVGAGEEIDAYGLP